MQAVIDKIRQNLEEVPAFMINLSPIALGYQPQGKKWSKKEILGHLADSALHNLQRFTEVQYEKKPYTIRKYQQDDQVRVNGYQRMELKEIIQLWTAINQQIIRVLSGLDENQLAYEILVEGETKTFRWLVEDYVRHMDHHIRQIMAEE